MTSDPSSPGESSPYDDHRDEDSRTERRLITKELFAIAMVIVVVVLRQLWLD